MKILKTANGKNKIKMSKKEWQSIGRNAGWSEDSDIVKCKGCNLKMRRAYVDKAGYCKECYNAMKEDVDKGRKEDQTIGKQHEGN